MRAGVSATLVCLLVVVGCSRVRDVTRDGVIRVVCFGDDNTAYQPSRAKWCEHLSARMPTGWATVNIGGWGLSAGIVKFLWAMVWVPRATDNTDAIVIALGTYDIGAGHTPARVVADIQKLVDAVATTNLPPGEHRAVFVLTIPPRKDSAALQAATDEANALLRLQFGDHLISLPGETLVDNVHLDDSAERARAVAVWKALSR